MNLISCDNHIVRKALGLSLNEMAVLCDIEQMSRNREFGGWCIKSKDKIADWLDLNRDTVFKIIKTLVVKGYVEKSSQMNGYRPTDFILKLMTSQEIAFLIRNGQFSLVSANVKSLMGGLTPSDAPSGKPTMTVGKTDYDRRENRHEPSEIPTQDIHIDKQLDKQLDNNIYTASSKKERKPREPFTPPTEKESIDFFLENGFSEKAAKEAHGYYTRLDWKDRNGSAVKNWKQKYKAVWFRDENKAAPKHKDEGLIGFDPVLAFDPNYEAAYSASGNQVRYARKFFGR